MKKNIKYLLLSSALIFSLSFSSVYATEVTDTTETIETTQENTEVITEENINETETVTEDTTQSSEVTVEENTETQNETNDESYQDYFTNQQQYYSLFIQGVITNETDYFQALKSVEDKSGSHNVSIKLIHKEDETLSTTIELNQDDMLFTISLNPGVYDVEIIDKTDNIKSVSIGMNDNLSEITEDTTIEIKDESNITVGLEYDIPEVVDEDKNDSFWLTFLKNNFVFLMLILGCGIALFILDNKKKNLK